MNNIYNTSNVKQMNLEIIRTAIKTMPGNTKALITSATGLSHATCNTLLNELVATGEVLELDKDLNSGGRPAQRYQYNAEFSNVISLYIDNDNNKPVIRYAVFNLIGIILEENQINKETVDYEIIEDVIGTLLQRHSAVKAIGIGIPGVVLKERFINSCDVETLTNCPLAEKLENRFGVNVVLENDMNASAIGYYGEQDYKEEASMAIVTFIKDNLPGSGIIVDGHILRGNTNFAGEIGFLPYGVSQAKQKELLSDSNTAFPFVIKSLCSLIAIINPETIILTGSLLAESMLEEINKCCEECIPKEHMPHIVFKKSIHNYYLKGLMIMSIKSLSFQLKIVEKKF